jgi:hypothetical protein
LAIRYSVISSAPFMRGIGSPESVADGLLVDVLA